MKGVHLSALYVGYTYLCTTVQCSLHVKVPCIIHCICIAMHCNALQRLFSNQFYMYKTISSNFGSFSHDS